MKAIIFAMTGVVEEKPGPSGDAKESGHGPEDPNFRPGLPPFTADDEAKMRRKEDSKCV